MDEDVKKIDEDVRKIIFKYAVKNAFDYGRAERGPVIGKLIADMPDVKKDMKNTMRIVDEIIGQVNAMSEEEVEKWVNEFEYAVKQEKTIEQKIKEHIPNAEQGKVITRIPPEPNLNALHIGHAKAMWLDKMVAEVFNGKCILRWDDTNPEKEKQEYVDAIRNDLESMGITWDEEVYCSDYMVKLYELADRLISQGDAYVCTCDAETIHKNRSEGKECACRHNTIDENKDKWNAMLSGDVAPGKAILRLKADMESKNTTMRDPTLFRIIDIDKYPHYRQGKKYHVWPSYDFQAPIMDSILGITHPIRSKEYEMRTEPYYFLLDKLNLRKPVLIHIGRLEIPGYPISKRLIKSLIDNGDVSGVDDPRLVTIKALIRRGITPEAIKNFALRFGISTSESKPSLDMLFDENRKIISPITQRRFFVKRPVKIVVRIDDAHNDDMKDKNSDNVMGKDGVEDNEEVVSKDRAGKDKVMDMVMNRAVVLNNHPSNESLGKRTIKTNGCFYAAFDDLKDYKVTHEFRLIGVYNIKIESMRLKESGDDITLFCKYDGEEMRNNKKIQWVPCEGAIPARISVPLKLLDAHGNLLPTDETMRIDDGLCEPSCAELKVGDEVQFERYGFVRLDKIIKGNNGKIRLLKFIFTHG
ncbi:glutamate--tRNA ligase [Candidatus Micrarchaeota archaeon]|nr:glutamate--tRNA ligase [Candidatus Micrarchaeota archaeon]